MKDIIDIQLIDLLFGLLILIVPAGFLLYFKIKLLKSVSVSMLRMVVQLLLIATYLEWIFEINSPWLNSLWVIMMMHVGVFTAIKRIGLNWRFFVIPFLIAVFTAVIIVDTFFLGVVLKLDNVFDARYFIPITGMVLGNSLNHNIVGLTAYYYSLSEKQELYYFLLTNTGEKKHALRPFVIEGIKRGLNPMIANMSVIGLISLPGVMTGQILGGSSPEVAIKYQIMIMLSVFVGCTVNLFTSILISNRFIFDAYDSLKPNVIIEKKPMKRGKH